MAANFLGAIMKHTQSTALPAVFGPLAFLSMQHVEPGECPQAPTNEERMRAFRNAQPVYQGNDYHWSFRHPAGLQAVRA